MAVARSKVSTVCVRGPLAPFVVDFRARLTERGYAELTTVNQLRVMAHLSRWLEADGFTAADLTEERIEQYLQARRIAGYTSSCTRRSMEPLLAVLCPPGTAPAATPASAVPIDAVLDAFGCYLLTERGLACSTAGAYVARARRFLTGCGAQMQLREVTAGDVTAAVLRESGAGAVGSAQYFVAGLRSFLRFCHVQGLIEADLSAAALALTGRRVSRLPQGISPTDATALLTSCDRRDATGLRDYAVILTLWRLGLRASEVAKLSLDDVDWRSGQLTVHGKGHREACLPLPDDVGEAITGYLRRGRPATTLREVFLHATAPRAALARTGVSLIVRRACVRAGVTQVGAHRLRHALACDMVRAGVPLAGIGDVLRHRDLTSTAGYARVDVDQLRSLAVAWPGGPGR